MKKIAIVGFGFIGTVHAENLLANEELDFCGIIEKREIDFRKINAVGNKGELGVSVEKLENVPVYKSLEECCLHHELDAVLICVPLFLHYELTKQALQLGLDVLLEKPFCPKAEQCRELIDLAKDKGRILMIGHSLRFRPAWNFMAECIHDHRFGKLKMLSMSRKGGRPTWGAWNDPAIRQTCGGGLWDLLIHDLDFVNHHLQIPQGVRVNVRSDDYWEMSFEREEAQVSIKGGFLYPQAPFEAEYFATFEHATIQHSTSDPGVVFVADKDGVRKMPEMQGNCYRDELQYFTECIHQRVPPEKCLPAESMQAIEICIAMEQGCAEPDGSGIYKPWRK